MIAVHELHKDNPEAVESVFLDLGFRWHQLGSRDFLYGEAFVIVRTQINDPLSLLHRLLNPTDWYWDDPNYNMLVAILNGVNATASRTPPPSKNYKDPEPFKRPKKKAKVDDSLLMSETEINNSGFGFDADELAILNLKRD